MVDEIVEEVCGNELCNCVVEDGEAYCTLYCEEADEAEVGGGPCACGHTACVTEPA